jgi:uncharacterized membrane protein SirB2
MPKKILCFLLILYFLFSCKTTSENKNKDKEINNIAYILIGSSFIIFVLVGTLKKQRPRIR